MVAVVKAGTSVRRILQYNEHKLGVVIDPKKGIRAAIFIHAAGFAKDTDLLTYSDKLGVLQKLTSLNERTRVNSIHISLNFHPDESVITAETLRDIADSYLKKLGFGNQPYLVYKHNDSSHPHIHIVTTNIQADGKRIPTHNIGRIRSEIARKAVEAEFGLIRARNNKLKVQSEIVPGKPLKISYAGASQKGIKSAIAAVLNYVANTYKFTSLAELNAVLRKYNLVAHQGSKTSQTARNNGLYYQALNRHGKPIGVPIPASNLQANATLKQLQQAFKKNRLDRLPFKRRIRNAIDLALLPPHKVSHVNQLQDRLRKENIEMVMDHNPKDKTIAAVYIDHQTNCVFQASELGPSYTTERLHQRILANTLSQQKTIQPKQKSETAQSSHPPFTATTSLSSIFSGLTGTTTPQQEEFPLPELQDQKKKRKKKKHKQ